MASVSGIVITAVRDVAHTVGGFATEVFEIRDAARRASRRTGSRIEVRRGLTGTRQVRVAP